LKSFYSPVVGFADATTVEPTLGLVPEPLGVPVAIIPVARARVAIYDDLAVAPHVLDIDAQPVGEFIETLSAKVYGLCCERGSAIPFTAIREIVENLIHANFAEPVISILDSGSTIRFADQGPGIADKDRALLPGFSTACGEMKQFIRGVGSGLPIVREYLLHVGGSIAIEDNLGGGAVVTLRANHMSRQAPVYPADVVREVRPSGEALFGRPARSSQGVLATEEPLPVARPRLNARQKQVLAIVLESGIAGPSLVSKEIGVGVSTAYRDLALLEEAGLIASEAGKRTLTPEGLSYLGELTNGA
jgi:hypothetical protein